MELVINYTFPLTIEEHCDFPSGSQGWQVRNKLALLLFLSFFDLFWFVDVSFSLPISCMFPCGPPIPGFSVFYREGVYTSNRSYWPSWKKRRGQCCKGSLVWQDVWQDVSVRSEHVQVKQMKWWNLQAFSLVNWVSHVHHIMFAGRPCHLLFLPRLQRSTGWEGSQPQHMAYPWVIHGLSMPFQAHAGDLCAILRKANQEVPKDPMHRGVMWHAKNV